jgi:preprotein translocase subunit SecF
MEFFREAKIDWMGKAKYFLILSAVLLLISGFSWYAKGGLRYGIDFRGGTLVYVRFAQKPPIDKIRQALSSQGLGESTIQEIKDAARPGVHEVIIGLEQKGEGDEALDAGKTAILVALRNTFGAGEEGKQGLNSVTPSGLTEYLIRRDPLGAGAEAPERYKQLARDILSYRDSEKSGLITNFDDLKNVPGVTDGLVGSLRGGFYLADFAVINVEIVGPKVGAQLRRQAVAATLYALAGMLVYIAFRFEFVYGLGAVLAVFHDVLITLGLFSIFNYEISLTVIAALLTLVGYSMNDTIVIFDRVRENHRLMRREPLSVIVNRSINQTLSRTILTSGLTFLTVLILFGMGGPVLRTFSFALVAGIMVGTYSSVGIAAPFVVAWSQWRGRNGVSGAGPGSGGRGRQEEPARERPVVAGVSRASATGGVRR